MAKTPPAPKKGKTALMPKVKAQKPSTPVKGPTFQEGGKKMPDKACCR